MHRIRQPGKRSCLGFTLMELMITVAIIAILATIAYPSYQSHIIRTHRANAQAAMMDIANREQQFLIANRVYANKATLESNGYALPNDINGRYTYDVAPGTGTVPSFTITFTPTGPQASDGVLTLDNTGVKTPADKW